LLLVAEDVILYRENLKDPLPPTHTDIHTYTHTNTHTVLDLVSKSSEFSRYKINIQLSVTFLHINYQRKQSCFQYLHIINTEE
jgi:hypothetical protein